jgi:RNA polymerase sigma-70 factor (ECF subfamily)
MATTEQDLESQPTDDGNAAESHEAFVACFARHVDEIQAYIGTLLPQAADADEVFQQTSIALWRNFGEFRSDGNFPAWACGIAFNMVRNFRRVESRRPVFLVQDDVLELLGQTQRASAAQVSPRREALTLCVEKLSKDDRELVTHCYGDSARIKDVAAEMGCTANALYKRLKIIRRLLFDCISRALAAEEDGR